jgi:RHS repeat-associated protein
MAAPSGSRGAKNHDPWSSDITRGATTEETTMYNPMIGRWMTEDPEGFAAADENLFRYVHNNATDLIDPSGLQQVGMQKVTFQDLYDAMLDSNFGLGGEMNPAVTLKDQGKLEIRQDLSLGGGKNNAVAVCLAGANSDLGGGEGKLNGFLRFGIVTEDPNIIKDCRWLQYIKVDKPKGTKDVGIDVLDDKLQKRYIPWGYWTIDTGNTTDPFYDSGPITTYLRKPKFVIISDRVTPGKGEPKLTGKALTFLVYKGKVVWGVSWSFTSTRMSNDHDNDVDAT